MSRATLLDATGRGVMSLRPGPNDVRALAPGVYFVREADGEGRVANAKVVLTRWGRTQARPGNLCSRPRLSVLSREFLQF
jgi:hypothetical protein